MSVALWSGWHGYMGSINGGTSFTAFSSQRSREVYQEPRAGPAEPFRKRGKRALAPCRSILPIQ